jgi:uncharacterized repeat protein (TIGR01451 family)
MHDGLRTADRTWKSSIGTSSRRARGRLMSSVALASAFIAAALMTAVPASAGTTSASTFTMSGIDTSNGSTASSGGPPGSTAAGHTINWVLNYRNTTGALANVNIADPITGNQTFVPGSLVVPPGLSSRWSTDGGATYSTTEPASGVSAIGASGQNIDGSTGSQAVAQPPTTGFNAGTTGGDGFEALFIGGNVYVVHHHRVSSASGGTNTMIDCHVKSTGASCPGFPPGGTYASPTPGAAFGTGPDTLDTPASPDAAVDAANGKIYFPAGIDGSPSVGVECIDVFTNTSCGYTRLNTQAGGSTTLNTTSAPTNAYAQIAGGGTIGSKYYLIDSAGNLYCYDYSTGSQCTGYPLAASVLDPGYTNTTDNIVAYRSQLQVFDNRYVFGTLAEPGSATGAKDLLCLDTTTNASCPGFPKVNYGANTNIALGTALAPLLDASGNVTGICAPVNPSPTGTAAPFNCWSLAGTNLGPAPWGQMVPGATANGGTFGSLLHIGPKLYFAYTTPATVATYTCWDFSTSAPCAGFVQGSSGAAVFPYTIRQDPYNPDCLWEFGNNGIFEVFSATFGGTTCNESPANVTIKPAAYYCDGAGGHVTGWNQIVLNGVTSADYNGASVTIKDASGNVVPGWNNKVFPNTQQTIDISSIPYSGSTATLQISVSFNQLAAGKSASVLGKFSGDPPQMCFKTVVGPAKCATAQAIANSGNAVTSVTGGVSDAPGGNSSGAATFTEAIDPSLCRADLAIVKTAGSSPGIPGGDETYTLNVSNNGPDTANNVKVSDPLPAGLTFVSASTGCTEANVIVTCTLSSLTNGSSHSFQVVTRIASSQTTRIDNTATVTSTTVDPNPKNNTSSAMVPLGPKVDLGITKTPSVAKLPAGGQVMYTLVVQNHGPSNGTGVTVSDPAPAGLSIVSAHPSQGTCTSTAATVSCSIGRLVNGGSAQILVTANLATTVNGPLSNVATVTGDQPDPNHANNSASATVTGTQPPMAQPIADLQVVKRVNHARAPFGQLLTYTLDVKNLGPSTATSVVVTDTSALPLHVTSIKTSQGSCKPGVPFTCQLGAIVVGQTVTITAKALPKQTGNEVNSVSTFAASSDPNPNNNVSAAKTTVRPYLLLSKTASARHINGGQDVSYELEVSNPTPAAVRNVTVCDQLPVGLAFVSSNPKSRLSNGSTCWKITKLAGHASKTITVVAAALPGSSGNLVNHATASADGVNTVHAHQTVSVNPAPPRPTPVTG